MKKLIFGLIALAVFGFTENAQAQTSTGKGRVVIKYDGGKLCWLGWSGCKGEIIIEWRQSPPKDIPVIDIPKGYSLVSLTTDTFDREDKVLDGERIFKEKEVSDGSVITIPKQTAYYSESLNKFFVYAK